MYNTTCFIRKKKTKRLLSWEGYMWSEPGGVGKRECGMAVTKICCIHGWNFQRIKYNKK